MGRKPIPEDMPVSLRLSKDDLANLDRISGETGRSRGDVIRRLIRLALPTAHLTIPSKDRAGEVRAASARAA